MDETKQMLHCGIRLRLFIVAMLITLKMPAATWSDYGSYDVSWYDKSKSEFYLSSPKQLAGVAYLVNNFMTSFSDKTLYLTADIDLDGKQWIPIGTANTEFKGTFDGQGHKIKSIIIKDAYSDMSGFWLKLNSAKISNVDFDVNISKTTGLIASVHTSGFEGSSEGTIGSIAAFASSTEFKNVRVENYINISEPSVSFSTGVKYYRTLGGMVGNSSKCTYIDIISGLC